MEEWRCKNPDCKRLILKLNNLQQMVGVLEQKCRCHTMNYCKGDVVLDSAKKPYILY